jgi:hypothetical protein
MAIVKDTTGEIEEGSIYLPQSKKVPIGSPVVGVGLEALKKELQEVYGDRFEVQEQGQEQQSAPEARPPARRKVTEEKPAE